MQAKRFVAADMRRALELVKQEIGPDAVILSNKRVKQGVEILATSEVEDKPSQLSPHSAQNSDGAILNSDKVFAEDSLIQDQMQQLGARRAVTQATSSGGAGLAEEIELAREKMLAAKRAEREQQERLEQASMASQAALSPQSPSVNSPMAEATDYKPKHSQQAGDSMQDELLVTPRSQKVNPIHDHTYDRSQDRVDRDQWSTEADYSSVFDRHSRSNGEEAQVQLEQLQDELSEMRLLLEQQIEQMSQPGRSYPQPVYQAILGRLMRLGLDQGVSHHLVDQLGQASNAGQAWAETLACLARQIPVFDADLVERGGIFAMVGPTGAGKTTTIGKLAARYVLQHGSDQVALVTTDTYRIAAHEQLLSLGKILKVPVRVVEDGHNLRNIIDSLGDRSLILVDTAGFNAGAPELSEQRLQLNHVPNLKTLLVMAANNQEQMLANSWQQYGGDLLSGAVVTKLDETASLGGAMNVLVKRHLPLAYTTNGQSIPGDISPARAHKLVTHAVSLTQQQRATSASTGVVRESRHAPVAMAAH